MKILACICSLVVGACAVLNPVGNGITLGASWTDPTTGAKVELRTAK